MAVAKKKPRSQTKASPYTKPALRARLKNQIQAGSKGGKPGQWSARKAQMLVQKYKAAGGGYRTAKRATQKSLDKWTGENWRTKDGKPAIRKDAAGKAVTKRYLPDRAWKNLTKGEAKATDAKKAKASRQGKQFAPNTRRAKSAGARVRKSPPRRK